MRTVDQKQTRGYRRSTSIEPVSRTGEDGRFILETGAVDNGVWVGISPTAPALVCEGVACAGVRQVSVRPAERDMTYLKTGDAFGRCYGNATCNDALACVEGRCSPDGR